MLRVSVYITTIHLGYDFLYGQAAEAKSSRYYCSAQWHSGETLFEIAVPADQNILGRYQDLSLEIKRILRATRVTVIPIAIGAFGTISGNAKARYRRLSLPDILNRGHVCKLLFIQHGFPFLFLLILFDSKQFCFLLLQTATKKFLVSCREWN